MPITKVLFLAQGFESGNNRSSTGYFEALSQVGSSLGDAKTFVAASVKWRPKGKFFVNKSVSPSMLGENIPSLSVSGSPVLAETIVKAADAAGLWAEATDEWGLDPGHWRPLDALRPNEGVAVVPLSLSQMSPEAHRKWGVSVRRGAQKHDEPLALVVSGSLSLRPDVTDEVSPLFSSIEKFDQELIRILTNGPFAQMNEVNRDLFNVAQPEGGWGSLYFLWGALGDKVTGRLEFYERPVPGIASAILSFSL